MDAGPGGYFSSSTLFKTSLLTIAFSTFYIYETKKRATVFRPVVVKTDTAVVVKLKPVIVRKKKTIYLTFDDGPNKGTRKVMDIMDAEQVPATVFIIGEHVYGSREQRAIFDSLISNNLFEIANHSYSHAFENKYRKFYEMPDSMIKDFERCADSLQLTSNIVRTPGRNVWRTANISSTDLKNTTAAADSL
jgi:peptidoglycan-N-acetylglucosamine deacetylase